MVKNNKQQESIVNTRQTPTANPSVDPVTVSGFNHYANGIRMKKNTLPVANDLTQQFGRGFSRQNLQQLRGFYQAWPAEQICQTASGKSFDLQTLVDRFPLPSPTIKRWNLCLSR